MVSNETEKCRKKEKRNQHFVPRFYLKYFVDAEKKFYRYDFLDNGEQLPS